MMYGLYQNVLTVLFQITCIAYIEYILYEFNTNFMYSLCTDTCKYMEYITIRNNTFQSIYARIASELLVLKHKHLY